MSIKLRQLSPHGSIRKREREKNPAVHFLFYFPSPKIKTLTTFFRVKCFFLGTAVLFFSIRGKLWTALWPTWRRNHSLHSLTPSSACFVSSRITQLKINFVFFFFSSWNMCESPNWQETEKNKISVAIIFCEAVGCCFYIVDECWRRDEKSLKRYGDVFIVHRTRRRTVSWSKCVLLGAVWTQSFASLSLQRDALLIVRV